MTATLGLPPGDPMLTLVDADELATRRRLRFVSEA